MGQEWQSGDKEKIEHPKSWVGVPVLTKRPYAREGGRPGSPGGLNACKRTRHVLKKCNSPINASMRLNIKHVNVFITVNGTVYTVNTSNVTRLKSATRIAFSFVFSYILCVAS